MSLHNLDMRFIAILICILISTQTFGQSKKFVSSVDQELTIQKITFLPFVDNVSGIYAKPLTEHLADLLQKDKQWTLVDYPSQAKTTPEEVYEKPDVVQNIYKKSGAQALVAGRISKGPNGITLRLHLFAGQSGYPLSSETLTDYGGFEISEVKTQLEELFMRMRHKLPYSGTLLSRRGQLVTINIGATLGLKENTEITAIQLMKVTRHPKFHFITSSETTIMGKILVTKVEDYLSFGQILSEREEGVLTPGTKVLVSEFVSYPLAPTTADGTALPGLQQRADAPLAYGEHPKEWTPEQAPTFGKVGIMFGLGSYDINNALSTQGVSAGNQTVPSIHVGGEMWITQNWFASFGLKQYAFSVPNNLSGSTPGKLNVSTLQTSLLGGYNFLVADDFWGPKIQLMMGMATIASTVDQSTPAAFNSMNFGGLNFGVAGMFPLETSQKKPFYLGGRLYYFLNPTVSESPTSSGSGSSAQISSFAATGDYRYSERMGIHMELMFDLMSASFSGAGTRTPSASSASHTITTLAAGIEYYF